MLKPDRSTYTPIDFIAWRDTNQLEISPRFQRRPVWSRAARSFLIDTMILGYPIPPVYIRVVRRTGESMPVREIIDGQQRISAVVDYIDGLYSLSNNIESPHKGRYFVDLPQEAQDQVVQYPFIAEVFYGIEDPDVLAIFARLNMNSVSLNAQELRNGRYFGPFKQSAYSLALAHLNFWRNNRIFTELNIARMKEVEFTSELMIALIDGMQDKKNSIEAFYRRYDDNFSNRSDVEDKFKLIIDEISEIIGYDLSRTEFRRTPLFYSMFLSLAHRLFGLPNTNLVRPAARFSNKDRERFRDVIVELSSVISDAKDGSRTPKDLAPFVGASLTQTDNIRPRQVRLHTIYDRAFV